MKSSTGLLLYSLAAATAILQFPASSARAITPIVHTMADWVGRNNAPGQTYTFDSQVTNAAQSSGPTDDNFVVISPTSIGGQKQAKVNYNFDPNNRVFEDPPNPTNINFPHLFLADQELDGPTLSFSTPLHMEGTISFDTPPDLPVEPNFFFGWYNSDDTRRRIGLNLSNVIEAPNTPSPDSLRVDLGYASLAGNRFYYVTADGTLNQIDGNSRLPDGTYRFTFDYVPGDPETLLGGSIAATVTNATHTYFFTRAPLDNAPWFFNDSDLNRFGVVARSTASTIRQGNFNFTISNVTYTGGTPVPESGGATLAMLGILGLVNQRRRRNEMKHGASQP